MSEPIVAAADPSAEAIEAAEHHRHARAVVLGTLCSFIGAILYTCTNIGLRDVAHLDVYLVSCIKAVPTFLMAIVMIAVDIVCGRGSGFPRASVTLGLLLTGVLAQLGGNVAFQWGLGVVGLAATVPLIFSMILVTGALLSHFWLGEKISRRAVLAMAVLSLAFVCVSLHTERVANRPVVDVPRSTTIVALAVATLFFSGFSYAVLGASIRRTVTGTASMGAVLMLISIPGLVCLSPIAAARLGIDGLLATSSRDLGVMLAAGTFHALAFCSMTKAMQLVPVAYVNIVNASQVAMAAAAGVILFHEPTTVWLAAGLLLTVVGLVFNRRPSRS